MTAISLERATATHLLALALLLGLGGVAGCSAGRDSRVGVASRDSSGVTVVTVSTDAVNEAPLWPVTSSPLVRIGDGEDPDEIQLVRVSGTFFWHDGQIAVGSDLGKRILLFDQTGKSLASRGRNGRGPGEFLHLVLIKSDSPLVVAAQDMIQRRLSLFSVPDTAPPTTLLLPSLSLGDVDPILQFSNGDLLVRKFASHQPPRATGVVNRPETILRVSPSGTVVASYGTHAGEDRVHRSGPGDGLEAPYPRRLLVGARDSTVYVAPMGPYELRRYHADGRLNAIVRVERARRPVTKEIIRQYRHRVLDQVTDAYGIAEWTTLSADDVFPDELAAFDQMLIDPMRRLWIRETATELDRTAQWVVFDTTGRPVARVLLPAPFMITDVHRDRVLGVWNDHEGPEEVRVYSVPAMAARP